MRDSIEGILHHHAQEHDQAKRLLILRDLIGKSGELSLESRRRLARRVVDHYLPDEARSLMSRQMGLAGRGAVDVVLLTVTEVELRAARLAFGVSSSAREHSFGRDRSALEFTIEPQNGRRALKAILAMVGRARNLYCYECTRDLLDQWRPELCILVGIAAGVRSRVALGDVVAPVAVADYEGARLELGGSKPRSERAPLAAHLITELAHFDTAVNRTYDSIAEQVIHLKSSDWDIPGPFKPHLHKERMIASGEKLIVDGSLQVIREALDERIVAADMESYGFATACEYSETEWLVFRGISDYGEPANPETDPQDKGSAWQLTSALAAAASARSFLDWRNRTV